MTPADFADIPRDQHTTDPLIAYSIEQAKEYAALHAPRAGTAHDALIRLFAIYTVERDCGERVHLRRGIYLFLGQYKWEQTNAS